VALLVRARWVILFTLFIYALYAGICYSLSSFGFFLSRNQTLFLLLILGGVVLYNLSYQKASGRLARFRYADHLQVFFDLLLVTVLVHYTGGAVSWVWTLYLIVTMEAVYLLERREEVWLAWGAGALLYGALLGCEQAGLLHTVRMPFVDARLSEASVFLLLIWAWVAILNAAVAAIGYHLMSISRGETLQLKESREHLFRFLEHASDLIQLNAPDGAFLYANRAWLGALGYRKDELDTLNLFDVVHADSQAFLRGDLKQVLGSGESAALDAVYQARDGRLINMEGSLSCSFRGRQPVAVWGICRDVTVKRRADQELYRMAHHDVLTGLLNRQLFLERLQELRGMASRLGRCMAVLYLDLDRFKSVNDTLGHAVGDKLLQMVANRLTETVRDTDTVARLGGDEFVIAAANLRDASAAGTVADKVLNALCAPYQIDSHRLEVSSSIGVSVYPEDGSELDDLVEKADIALYRAKQQGRGCCRRYSGEAAEKGAGTERL